MKTKYVLKQGSGPFGPNFPLRSSKILLSLITSFLLVFLLSGSKAMAASYYVSPTGNDSSSGSVSAPFKTIQKAANIVNPGDMVIVRAGTYGGVSLTRGGTSANWVTFKAYPGETVIIDPYSDNYAGGRTRGFTLDGSASYVEINGFKITETNPKAESSNYADYSDLLSHDGIKAQPNASGVCPHDLRIYNNEIYHMGMHGIFMHYQTYNVEIYGNTLYNNGPSKRGYGMYVGGNDLVVINNISYGNYGHGIQIANGNGSELYRTLIENNLVYNNGNADYCKGYSNCPYNCPNGCPNGLPIGDGIVVWRVNDGINRNNIIYSNLDKGIWENGTNNLTMNNTIYNNGGTGIYAGFADRNNTFRNNISYGHDNAEYSIPASGNIQDHNLFGTNPLFVNAINGNLHLQSGSPAINKGAYIEGYDYDADGKPIVGVPDIGAYEYGSSTTPPPSTQDTTPPSVPTGLTATAVSSSQINLAWKASTDNAGISGYKVYRGTSLIATTTTTSYADTGLAAATTHTYRVSAFDTTGNVSGQSATASATTQTPSDTQSPSVPATLLATAISTSQINLSWTASSDNVGVTGYKIYRNGTQIATATTTSYSNTGLTASTSYTYAVSAFDAAGNVSGQSAFVSAKTKAAVNGKRLKWLSTRNGTQIATTTTTTTSYSATTKATGNNKWSLWLSTRK